LEKIDGNDPNAREQFLEKANDSHSRVRQAVHNGLRNADNMVRRIEKECNEYKKQSDAIEECEPGFHNRSEHFFLGQRVRARNGAELVRTPYGKQLQNREWRYGAMTDLNPVEVLLDEYAEHGLLHSSYSFDEVENAEPIIPQCRETVDPSEPIDRDLPERAKRRAALRASLDRMKVETGRTTKNIAQTWGERIRREFEVRLNQMSAVQTWWKVADTVLEQECQS